MSKQSNKKQQGLSQLIFAAIVIGLPAISMVKMSRGNESPPVVKAQQPETQAPPVMVPVREDSLEQLLYRFADRHSSMATVNPGNGVMSVHMARLGSNASIFYGSNK